jgi:cytochrome c biogenesis protein CcmG, thiol:disulfide interchange protein DsbE
MAIARREFILAAGAACVAGGARGAQLNGPAAPFDVFTADWRKIRYADMAGKVIVLHYWASWNPASMAELPRLDAYARRHAGAPLLILSARADDNAVNQTFGDPARGLALTSVLHFDGRGYGPIANTVPTSYVIDAAGVLRYARAGAFTTEGLEQVVTPLLSNSQPVMAAEVVPGQEYAENRIVKGAELGMYDTDFRQIPHQKP